MLWRKEMITWLTTWLKKHHWIHDFGKWEPWYGTLYPQKMKSLAIEVSKQQRHCKICNKEEIA
jgi:hypothetical protein